MSRLLAPLLLVAAAIDAPGPASGATAPDEPVVLVELFTSEGCSSCPPADALLGELAGGGAGAVRVLALSEHVDYWDDLGWRDRFSSPLFTRRQEAYARRLGVSALYTPQVVVAGQAEALGSDRRAVRAAIAAAARAPSGRVAARIVAGAAGPSVAVDASWRDGVPGDVLVAVVQDRATTRVAAGENAGRTLRHVAVVRSLAVIGAGLGAFSGAAMLPPSDALDAGHLVVFVQERGAGPVLAATALELP